MRASVWLTIAVVAATVAGPARSVPAAEILVGPDMPVEKALAAAKPGDVVLLPDGVHKDLRIVFEAAGQPEKPVTLRAKNPGKCILTGVSNVTIKGRHGVVEGLVFDQAWGDVIVLFNGATDCRLTDCAFIECGRPASPFGRSIDMKSKSQRNRVDHCFMQGNLSQGMGVTVSEPDNQENTDNAFDHNYFRDIVARAGNGQESIQIGQGGLGETKVRAVVEWNLFERASGDPEIISNKSSGNTYRFNTFRDCKRSELVLRGGHEALVYGNFFFGCKGGVRMHGKRHTVVGNYIEGAERGILIPTGSDRYDVSEDCLIAHNTIVNVKKEGIQVGYAPPAGAPPIERTQPARLKFLNNLVVSGEGRLMAIDSGTNLAFQGNLVHAIPPTHGTRQADPGLKHEGIRAVDPGLVKADGLMRLPPTGSPAQDAAVAVVGFKVTDDIDGQPRDAKPDVGCDEVSAKPIVRRPLEPKDVGPTWMKGDPSGINRIDSPQPIPSLKKK